MGYSGCGTRQIILPPPKDPSDDGAVIIRLPEEMFGCVCCIPVIDTSLEDPSVPKLTMDPDDPELAVFIHCVPIF